MPIIGTDDATPVGYSGERILTTAVFRDGNIPANGAATQMLVEMIYNAVMTVLTSTALALTGDQQGQARRLLVELRAVGET